MLVYNTMEYVLRDVSKVIFARACRMRGAFAVGVSPPLLTESKTS